jgi:GxxExxY protein
VKEPEEALDRLAHAVIGAAIEVHRVLGPGYLESVYQEAMEVELRLRGIAFERQVVFAVDYKGTRVGEGRIDRLVQERLVVELKTADALVSIHTAQALSYLRALDLSIALLINLKVAVLSSVSCGPHDLPLVLASWRLGGVPSFQLRARKRCAE